MVDQIPGLVDFTRTYRHRVLDEELDTLMPSLPALLLHGPKGVGKTATATQRCATLRRLDEGPQRAIVGADPRVIGGDRAPVLLDEWQRVPEVFDAVRRLVDEGPSPGHFLLTGRAPTRATHSGAGRVATLRMRPLCLSERYESDERVSFEELLLGRAAVRGRCPFRLEHYVEELTSGGFPGLRHLSGAPLRRQLDGYIERIVDHDMPEAGHAVRRPQAVRAWLRAYAAANATTTSWEKIRDAATSGGSAPARGTTLAYIDLLTYLHVLDPLEAWSPGNNHLGQLTTAPKHHLADPALAARLVKRSAVQLLDGQEPEIVFPREGTYLGGLFESMAAISVRTYAQRCKARVFHLRTRGGRQEIDFIVETGTGVLGVEAKLSAGVDGHDVRHLLWLREGLGDECLGLVVLNAGPEAYVRPDGIAVVPVGSLGP